MSRLGGLVTRTPGGEGPGARPTFFDGPHMAERERARREPRGWRLLRGTAAETWSSALSRGLRGEHRHPGCDLRAAAGRAANAPSGPLRGCQHNLEALLTGLAHEFVRGEYRLPPSNSAPRGAVTPPGLSLAAPKRGGKKKKKGGLPAGDPPASRNGDDLVENPADSRNLLHHLLGDFPPFLPIHGAAQRHVAAVGGDEHSAVGSIIGLALKAAFAAATMPRSMSWRWGLGRGLKPRLLQRFLKEPGSRFSPSGVPCSPRGHRGRVLRRSR